MAMYVESPIIHVFSQALLRSGEWYRRLRGGEWVLVWVYRYHGKLSVPVGEYEWYRIGENIPMQSRQVRYENWTRAKSRGDGRVA